MTGIGNREGQETLWLSHARRGTRPDETLFAAEEGVDGAAHADTAVDEPVDVVLEFA